MANSEKVHIKISPDLKDKIGTRAEKESRTWSGMARTILTQAFEDCEHHIYGNKCNKCGRVFK